jgi:hypothetical protein
MGTPHELGFSDEEKERKAIIKQIVNMNLLQ